MIFLCLKIQIIAVVLQIFFNIISLFDIRKRKTLVTNKYLIDTQYETLKLAFKNYFVILYNYNQIQIKIKIFRLIGRILIFLIYLKIVILVNLIKMYQLVNSYLKNKDVIA